MSKLSSNEVFLFSTCWCSTLDPSDFLHCARPYSCSMMTNMSLTLSRVSNTHRETWRAVIYWDDF